VAAAAESLARLCRGSGWSLIGLELVGWRARITGSGFMGISASTIRDGEDETGGGLTITVDGNLVDGPT
jgi:hypothetical protein